MITPEFILGGKAIFTISLPKEFADKHQQHYTFKISLKENPDGSAIGPYFVSVLTGPDNWANYSYIGILDEKTKQVRTTAKSKWNSETFGIKLLNRVLFKVFSNDSQSIIDAGFDVHHVGKCGRCLAPLTVPLSIETGFGPECRKILGMVESGLKILKSG